MTSAVRVLTQVAFEPLLTSNLVESDEGSMTNGTEGVIDDVRGRRHDGGGCGKRNVVHTGLRSDLLSAYPYNTSTSMQSRPILPLHSRTLHALLSSWQVCLATK